MRKDSKKLFDVNLALLFGCAMALMSSFYLLLPVLPPYALEVGGSESQVGFIIGAFALSSLLCRPLVGMGVDSIGRKLFVLVGAVIFTVSSAGYAVAKSVVYLIALRILHGSGMASFQTSSFTMVVDSVPAHRRGEALGFFGISSNVAMAAAPALGSAILAAADFAMVFRVSAALALLSVALALPLREKRYGEDVLARCSAEDPQSNNSAAQNRTTLFCREALLPSFAIFAVMLTYGATLTCAPLLIIAHKLAPKPQVALFFTFYAVALIAARGPAGKLSDRKGRVAAALPGMLLVASAMACLAAGTRFGTILVGAILYGMGMALAQPALTASAVDSVAEARRGSAMGTFTAAFELGIGLGAISSGALAAASGFRIMFAAASASTILAASAYGLRAARRHPTMNSQASTVN